MNVGQMRNILKSLPDTAEVWVVEDDGGAQYTPDQHALLGDPVESIVFRRSPNPGFQKTRDALRRTAIKREVYRELADRLRAEVGTSDETEQGT